MMTIKTIISYRAPLSARPTGSIKERREWAAENGYCVICASKPTSCGFKTCSACRERRHRYR